MLSFRKKIFITYLIVFCVFVALVFPFATKTVEKVVVIAMEERSNELIDKIQDAKDNEDLIAKLRQQRFMIFFRVALITDERKVIYDSHVKRVLGAKFDPNYIAIHPEVEEAFTKGTGYHEDYSNILGGQKFAYMAKTFDFHGKKYVIRTAFPYKYVVQLTNDFKIGFVILAGVILLLFTLMTWFIVHYLSRPIQQIINEIRPYQEGHTTQLPEIKINTSPADDFGKLALTINSMSAKIQNHIDILTQERNEKEATLESLVEGVIAVDPNMVITFANNMAAKFLRFEKDAVIGQNFSILNQSNFYALLADCQKEKKVLTDNIQIKKESRKVFLDIVAAPKKDHGAVLVLQDKSEHYKILEMRKDFIANASHELKTPITIIQGFAEALHDNPDLPQETSHEVTGKIVKNCERMTSLIKDLLTLADIENLPTSRLHECDLEEILLRCREMVLEVYPDANIAIEKHPETEFFVTADPELIEMALFNLIENAAKYSNPPAEIHVILADEGENIKIAIADKGIGIPEQDLEFIFQRFYTVEKSRAQKFKSTGLGLSIVESIIEKHNGKISVTSTVGVGTTFTIILPKKI